MMDERTRRRIDDMQTEIGRLRRELEQRPLISVGGSSPEVLYVLNNIEGGTVLWTSGAQSISGIQYNAATSVTTVPNASASIPAIGTFAVGLGRASLLGGGTVYVALRPNPGTGVITGIVSDIPNDSVCLSVVKTTLPLVSDATVLVDVYIAYRF